MKYFSDHRHLSIVLSIVIATIFVANWLLNINPIKSFIEPAIFEKDTSVVRSIDAEFIDKTVYLNVHLKKYISCEEVIKLGVQSFDVKNNTYRIAGCSHVSDLLIKIVYIQMVTV